MPCRISRGAFVFAAALTMTMSSTQAAEEGQYPNWKGQWITNNPRFGGQAIKFDSDQGLGRGAAGSAHAGIQEGPRRQHGRPGQGRIGQLSDRALPAERHAAHHGLPSRNTSSRRKPPTSWWATTSAASSPMGAIGRPSASRATRATRSANGSTSTAMAATTCSKSRPADRSRGRAPTTPQACRFISTTSRSSRSAFHLDKPTRTCCTTKSP